MSLEGFSFVHVKCQKGPDSMEGITHSYRVVELLLVVFIYVPLGIQILLLFPWWYIHIL